MIKNIKCRICSKIISGEGTNGKYLKKFKIHLQEHSISYKEYYDTYCKKDNEGICKVCGKESMFFSSSREYIKFCEDCFIKTKIVCEICGKEYFGDNSQSKRSLTLHLKNKHNLKYINYYDIYINNGNNGYCKICGKNTKIHKKKRRYNIYCSNKCAAVDVVDKNTETINRLNKDVEFQKKRNKAVSEKAVERLNDPNDRFGNYYGNCSYYKNIYMRSSWEINFAKKLDIYNIKWEYEPKRFILDYSFEGKRRYSYRPDFYLPEYNIWIDVKPHNFTDVWWLELRKRFESLTRNTLIFLDIKDFDAFINDL